MQRLALCQALLGFALLGAAEPSPVDGALAPDGAPVQRRGTPDHQPDPLTTTPRARLTTLPAVVPRGDLLAFGPGIQVRPGQVVAFSGRVNFDQGPEDGLEALVSLHGQKLHESLIELDSEDALRVLAALVLALGEPRGVPADPLTGLHPRGLPGRITVRWQGVDGGWRGGDLASLVRDRLSDRPLPALPVVFSGGRVGEYQYPDGQGGTISRRQPVLAVAGNLVALFDEENGAPLALAVPDPRDDRRWEANSALLPHRGTPVVVEIGPATPLLSIAADEVGPGLAELLARPGPPAGQSSDAVSAVVVRLPPGAPRAGDTALVQEVAAAAMAAHLPLGTVLVPADPADGVPPPF